MKIRHGVVLAMLSLAVGCGGEKEEALAGTGPSEAQVRRLEAACAAQQKPLVDCGCAVRLAASEFDQFGYDYFIDVLEGDAMSVGVRRGESREALGEAMRGLRTISAECAL